MLQKLGIKGEIYFFLKLWAYSIIAMPLIAQSALDTMLFLAVQYCWDCSIKNCQTLLSAIFLSYCDGVRVMEISAKVLL